MPCRRCNGLMIGFLLDHDAVRNEWIYGWRCVNCGAAVDPRLSQAAAAAAPPARRGRRPAS